MRMTTSRLILLRLYLATFGRFARPARFLKRLLIALLIRKSAEPHVPSSRFFTPDQLEGRGE